jgi:hypothetical protein
VFLAISLRNVGSGMAVLQAWHPNEDLMNAESPQPDVDQFRTLRRDQYIPGGGVGAWQGALRDPADPVRTALAAAATERRPFSVDLLYTDQVGGQRTISSFGVLVAEDGHWVAAAGRHWYLDAVAPR